MLRSICSFEPSPKVIVIGSDHVISISLRFLEAKFAVIAPESVVVPGGALNVKSAEIVPDKFGK